MKEREREILVNVLGEIYAAFWHIGKEHPATNAQAYAENIDKYIEEIKALSKNGEIE